LLLYAAAVGNTYQCTHFSSLLIEWSKQVIDWGNNLDYIVWDIEFNGRKFASELPMEVIEIGAVRLDSSLQLKDEFTALIKPVYFSRLNSFIKQKTGIPQQEIDQAQGFREVISAFMDWLNQSESVLFVTWGGEDMKRIVLDTRMHELDDTYWMSVSYFDLLKGYLRFKKVTNDVSVEGALLDLDIPIEGSAHRALDDARMTAAIFRKIYSELDFAHQQQFKDTYSNSKERRRVKNAVKAMSAQKVTPEWELVVQHYLTGKVDLTDARKIQELHEYFDAEINSPQRQGDKR
jgi:inhibitor of KinA sporulation pathway (predicted exonuclease)